jgi:hypothetical protein
MRLSVAKIRLFTMSVSVRLSECNNSSTPARSVLKFMFKVFVKVVDPFQFGFKSDYRHEHFTGKPAR